MVDGRQAGHCPWFAIMIRCGSWMLNNDGLFRYCRYTSVSGKATWFGWERML
jgi:hypothetical protein